MGGNDSLRYCMHMYLFGAILNTDDAINDVVAYINTLEGPAKQSNELAVVE